MDGGWGYVCLSYPMAFFLSQIFAGDGSHHKGRSSSGQIVDRNMTGRGPVAPNEGGGMDKTRGGRGRRVRKRTTSHLVAVGAIFLHALAASAAIRLASRRKYVTWLMHDSAAPNET